MYRKVTVKLDNGEVIAVVQVADGQSDVGDKGKVLRCLDCSVRILQQHVRK